MNFPAFWVLKCHNSLVEFFDISNVINFLEEKVGWCCFLDKSNFKNNYFIKLDDLCPRWRKIVRSPRKPRNHLVSKWIFRKVEKSQGQSYILHPFIDQRNIKFELFICRRLRCPPWISLISALPDYFGWKYNLLFPKIYSDTYTCFISLSILPLPICIFWNYLELNCLSLPKR